MKSPPSKTSSPGKDGDAGAEEEVKSARLEGSTAEEGDAVWPMVAEERDEVGDIVAEVGNASEAGDGVGASVLVAISSK